MPAATTYRDRVQETTASIGTGAIELAGAVSGFASFSSAFGVGVDLNYVIDNGAEWEVGRGALTSSTSLSRMEVLASSSGGSLVNFSAGTKKVFSSIPADQVTRLAPLAGGAGFDYNATSRSLTVGGATVTTSQPVATFSQTWNNAAVAFTGLRLDVTDTASAAASLLMDMRTGGVSSLSVTKTPSSGVTTLSLEGFIFRKTRNQNYGQIIISGAQLGFAGNGQSIPSIFTGSATPFGWYSASDINAGGSVDLLLTRRAAANLRLGAADAAAPVAQTLSVQSVVAGTSNTAGANLTITGSQGTGTGAGGSILLQVAPAGSSGTAQNALQTALTIHPNRTVTIGAAYTVATLPAAGVQGRRAWVTDANSPTYCGTVSGGGSVVVPVFDNGTAWIYA